jgi:predicted nucleotidyltransferase
MAEDSAPFDELLDAMKIAAGVLLDAGVPFLVGGGLAFWARGGPKTEHDVDFLVKPEDAEQALKAFEDAGYRTARPPERWLYKAWVDDVLIDLIFEPINQAVDDAMFERGEDTEVYALRVRVASLEDVVVSKLLAISEQDPDFASVLEMASSLREQIDWEFVRKQTDQSAFAKSFFTLIEELGIIAA